MNHGQTEPRSLTRSLGRKERFGGLGERNLIHADPVIGNHDAHIVAGLERRFRRDDALRGLGRRNRQRAAGRHGVARVQRHVEQRQFQLVGIHQRCRQCVLKLGLQLDTGSQRTLQQFPHAGHQLRAIDGFRFKLLPARECQQPLCQRGASLGPLHGVLQQAMASRVVRQPLFQQAQAAQNRHQQIVEIVSDAARQLPDGIHLLRFEQLRERSFPLPRPFLYPQFQLLIETLQLGGSLGDAILELCVEPLERTGLAVQIHEHLDLGPHQLGNHRNRHVIDRAE